MLHFDWTDRSEFHNLSIWVHIVYDQRQTLCILNINYFTYIIYCFCDNLSVLILFNEMYW